MWRYYLGKALVALPTRASHSSGLNQLGLGLLKSTSSTILRDETEEIGKDFLGLCWLGKAGQNLGDSLS